MRKVLLKLWFILFLLISACEVTSQTPPEGAVVIPIAPEFHNFLHQLGEDEFGVVISQQFQFGHYLAQFTEKALVVHTPDAGNGYSFRLWPLGNEMQVEEPAIERPAILEDGALYLHGHVIPAAFARLFEQIGGVQIVGRPLTECRWNAPYRRYEQFFENLGFYIKEGEPEDSVHLLAYGSWRCGSTCVKGMDDAAQLDLEAPIPVAFSSLLNRLGSENSGYLLVSMKMNVGGREKIQAVFKNVVAEVDPELPDQALFLDVPRMVGILEDQPTTSSGENGFTFITTKGDLGFNVPNAFISFIEEHGGFETIGLPVTHYAAYGDMFRQCFQKLCLLFDPEAYEWLQVQVEALGTTYKQVFQIQSTPTAVQEVLTTAETSGVDISTWETYQYLPPEQNQTIHALLRDQQHRPLMDVAGTLFVQIPGKGNTTIPLPPTGEDGLTMVDLPVISAEIGTVIPYSVCFDSREEQSCVEGDYIIWRNP